MMRFQRRLTRLAVARYRRVQPARWYTGHRLNMRRREPDGRRDALRDLHRPEHVVGADRRTVAPVRGSRLRQPVGLRSLCPTEPPDRAVFRGLVAAGRPGGGHEEGPDRRAGELQHVPPPGPGREDGGDDRPHLRRPGRRRASGPAGTSRSTRCTASSFPSPPELVSRFREAVEIVDSLLRNEVTTYQGKHYQLEEALFRPQPIQRPRPPLTLGAHGPRMMRIVAQYADAWNSFGTVEEMRQRNAVLDEQCAAIGRDPKEIWRGLYGWAAMMPSDPWQSLDAFADMVGQVRRGRGQRVHHRPAGRRAVADGRARRDGAAAEAARPGRRLTPRRPEAERRGCRSRSI